MLNLKAQFKSFTFDQLMSIQGEVYRAMPGRRTQLFMHQHQRYFIKHHYGVGWKEIFKNLLNFKKPIISAKNEWQALLFLKYLNIPCPEIVAFGQFGWNPAKKKSFIITKSLPPTISLEDYCAKWDKEPPLFRVKQALIREVARIARILHESGVNHRDFYICHFLLDLAKDATEAYLYVIDLHRASIRKIIPLRWRIKDLAGLYFSSKDIGLTRRDLLRFIREYRNKPLRDFLIMETSFWEQVKHRGDKLYDKTKRQHAESIN